MDVPKRGMSDTNQQALFHQYCIDTFQHSEPWLSGKAFWDINKVREEQRNRFITGNLGDDDELVVFYTLHTNTDGNTKVKFYFRSEKESQKCVLYESTVCTKYFFFMIKCNTYRYKNINSKRNIQESDKNPFEIKEENELPFAFEIAAEDNLFGSNITNDLITISLHPFLCVQSLLYVYKTPRYIKETYEAALKYINKIQTDPPANKILSQQKINILFNIINIILSLHVKKEKLKDYKSNEIKQIIEKRNLEIDKQFEYIYLYQEELENLKDYKSNKIEEENATELFDNIFNNIHYYDFDEEKDKIKKTMNNYKKHIEFFIKILNAKNCELLVDRGILDNIKDHFN